MLSQYPTEQELLWPPLTLMTVAGGADGERSRLVNACEAPAGGGEAGRIYYQRVRVQPHFV
jgi:hypothetical protein